MIAKPTESYWIRYGFFDGSRWREFTGPFRLPELTFLGTATGAGYADCDSIATWSHNRSFSSWSDGTSNIVMIGEKHIPTANRWRRGSVCFRNAERTRMFQGALKPGGTFELGEIMDGDGIPAGKYSAWIFGANTTDYVRTANGNITDQQTQEILIDPKFDSPVTSGLTFEIESGKKNNLGITVEKPKK